MVSKTLRIKKEYFNQIAMGEKKIEYRAEKPYYRWLFTIKIPFKLVLHYQKNIYLTVIVKKVKNVKTPKFIPKEFVPTERCWELHF